MRLYVHLSESVLSHSERIFPAPSIYLRSSLSLLLIMLQNLMAIKLMPTWKLHPHWLDFIVLEGSVHATGGEKSSTVLSIHETFSYANDHMVRYAYESTSGVGVVRVTNHFLT